MLKITEHSIKPIVDPFNILTGERFEFILDLDVPEEDELYSETGLYVRVLYKLEDGVSSRIKYDLYDKKDNEYLEFDLEDDELAVIDTFCKEHLNVK